ncbi:ARM repeat-containing protein [Lentinus tigrinus ALCF2SS1-7]|uniref:ARM repeat-containing protein n=1 Tax=Lentinus tigrinus ALCF2SS1-6 TaxID=1328759 RepID=A0A5C2SRA6_9APHY|nr:ARM repeat-containing protein [Lentinus tigrinus ALCF2SS1-6]RPD80303.1 ARM repeat-containing protein [Lentinus tigrinus ALCF2SS1-7]
MDVPFSSSGAMSRAHYALVRKIETATPQAADQILLAEVHSIRNQLTRSTLTLKQCKECLILLLYCSMAVNAGVHVDLEFALPHAINLAEAGQTIQDKRTGYLFCAEVMPAEHELQLMLVNSIRKDLESPSVSRICLALDTLIQSPSKDVIPAMQSRLHDLLSYNSSDVKRRAVLAFHKLSELDSDILADIVNKTRKRLHDSDEVVVSAALTLARSLVNARYLATDKYHDILSELLRSLWSRRPSPSNTLLLAKIVQAITQIKPSSDDLQVVAEMIHHYSRAGSAAYAIIYQCFRALAASATDVLSDVQTKTGMSFIKEIRHLLTVNDANALYVFICSLSSVDPKLWAGTSPGYPAVLEEWEVERVMKLLEYEDRLIRKQTLRTLWIVDQSIVQGYYARALQGDLPVSAHGTDDNLPRLLEILDIMCGDDGEAYAHQLKNALKVAEGDSPLNRRMVLQEAVEEMLTRIHAADSTWRSGCIGVLFTSVIDKDSEVGPTLMVILTALCCEYLELSPISPIELLRGLAGRLSSYSASVQDATLVTMLRVSAATDEVPQEVTQSVKELHEGSGRHLRRRCNQFITLSESRDALKRVISSTHSSSLPEFVMALEKYEAEQQRAPSRSPVLLPSSPPLKPHTPEPSSSRTSPVPGKLRYAAYEPPRPTQRLRRMSSGSSRHSDDGGSRRSFQDPMSMTVTPGDLTIAAQTSDLSSIPTSSPRQTGLSPLPIVQILDEEPPMPAADLIALDSPFMSEPAAPSIASTLSSIVEQDFETTWNALESGAARGWCESSMDAVLRKLQGLQRMLRVTERDRPPFEGDLKIVICTDPADHTSKTGVAAIRLKESDDDSCLWWMRCEDEALRNIIKATLR